MQKFTGKPARASNHLYCFSSIAPFAALANGAKLAELAK
jgi:hypothetical protein